MAGSVGAAKLDEAGFRRVCVLGAIKQRIQSSRIPLCHRHMVIATNLSSLFDLLHCSIPQTRAECCVEFAVVSGY